jgi:tetratricopeptide (TPR) repeat protein
MAGGLPKELQDALGGVYIVERELGGGAMSRVFVAQDPALGRRIVLKILPPEMAAAVSVERFRREIQFAASLLHPHIIPLLSAGEAGGIPYYTMPFVEAESLRGRLARGLHTRLSPTDRSRIEKKPTDDLEAYNLYLLGRHHYNKVTPADFSKAVDYYRGAIARDANFARAYASLAEAHLYLGLGYWGVRPGDTFPEVFALATTALELDPQSAEAYAALGLYHEWYEYRWEPAGAALERAVDLSPSSPMIRMYYAMHLMALGRVDEAIAQRDLACQLDPSGMAVRGNATWVLYLARRMDQAVAEARTLREIEPASAYGAFSHGLVCAQGGDTREAIAAFRDAVRLSDGMSLYLVMLAYGLAVGHEEAEARTLLEELRRRAEHEFIWPMGLAMAHGHLGDENVALDYLERAYAERVGWMPLLSLDPAFAVLRPSPRFQALLRKIGPG